MLQVNTD